MFKVFDIVGAADSQLIKRKCVIPSVNLTASLFHRLQASFVEQSSLKLRLTSTVALSAGEMSVHIMSKLSDKKWESKIKSLPYIFVSSTILIF